MKTVLSPLRTDNLLFCARIANTVRAIAMEKCLVANSGMDYVSPIGSVLTGKKGEKCMSFEAIGIAIIVVLYFLIRYFRNE